VLRPDPIRMVATVLEDDLCGQPKNCVVRVKFPRVKTRDNTRKSDNKKSIVVHKVQKVQ
jgi:hypothetical protein